MFKPPHCPNSKCEYRYRPPKGPWYSNFGLYWTEAFGEVPRFRCRKCRRTFSRQTFSIDYYVKKVLDYQFIFRQITSAAGVRNIGRNLKVSHNTISNRIARMGRNAIIAHERIIRGMRFGESLVLDGFESFCESQYHPDNFNIVVGAKSQFVYRVNYSPLRRKGRMTTVQKRERALIERIWKPSPKAVEKSVAALFRWMLDRPPDPNRPVLVDTDEKRDYVRALHNDPVCREAVLSDRIRHRRTNSKKARNYWNPLFAVNYIDRELRKDLGAHARESVKFNRNVTNGMLRMNLYLFEHNYIKPFRVAYYSLRDDRHAYRAGLSAEWIRRWTRGFLTRRFFWLMEDRELEGPGRVTLERGWRTPPFGIPERPQKWMSP